MNSLGNKEIMSKNIRYYMNKMGKERMEMCEDLGVKNFTPLGSLLIIII